MDREEMFLDELNLINDDSLSESLINIINMFLKRKSMTL